MFLSFNVRDLVAFTLLLTLLARWLFGFFGIIVPIGIIVAVIRERMHLQHLRSGPHNIKVETLASNLTSDCHHWQWVWRNNNGT
jgi:hypothetical protein